MTSALTSLLLATLTIYYGRVNADTSPRPRCPIMCSCRGRGVFCSHTFMTDVPQLPVNTENILLRKNNISRIRANAFSEVHKLTELTLQYNNIRSLDGRAFEGLSLLRTFTLIENSVVFESGVFRFFYNVSLLSLQVKYIHVPQREICMLKQLQQLTLGTFEFPYVKFDDCFEGLQKLKVLTLYDMKQSNISRATFRPFRYSLTELNIRKCGIRSLDVDTFKDLSKLNVLSLTENAITYLPSTIFMPLTSLTHLYIAEDKLKVIPDGLLSPLRYLENLFISGVSPMKLTIGEDFINMTRLQQIVFRGIKKPSLDNTTFRHLRHCPITSLKLAMCSIQTISRGALMPFRNLSSFNLYSNPLNGSVLHDALYGLQGSQLRSLYLSGLYLRDYPTALFEGLKDNNITTLVMNTSRITVIKNGLFRNLGAVSSLDLRSNHITTLEDQSFKDLVVLSTLIIDG